MVGRYHAQVCLALLALVLAFGPVLRAQEFRHPGILHSQADLDRMKKAVADHAEPIYSGYRLFAANPASAADYVMQGPLPMVGRNPTVGQGIYDSDANAAHQNAVMWYLTGNQAYADKSIAILNAWSYTLKSITGRDAVLMAGLGPFKMINAAEIIRYTGAGWSAQDMRQAELHFKTVIYPVVEHFAPFANGNWDAAAIKTVMAIGVFCNDRGVFERGLRYAVSGAGNGSLSHYIINREGQVQESGRDQGHTQLGIGMLAECAAIAWNQGLDLYGYDNNLLLRGFEYTAKYNLGHTVPFTPETDHTGKYSHQVISKIDSGSLRAVYEQVYHHYVIRRGLSAPYVQQAAQQLRPEGPGRPGADHPGYGTLYYTLTPSAAEGEQVRPAAPAGLTARSGPQGITLRWVAPAQAARYLLMRADAAGGPYRVISNSLDTSRYTDRTVKKGKLYYYTLKAVNAAGESPQAFPVSLSAGLPAPWTQQDTGGPSAPGETAFDGRVFSLRSAGTGAGQFNFTSVPLQGDGELTLRILPQPSSQFTRAGIVLRDQQGRQVSLLLYPAPTADVEAPEWQIRLCAAGPGQEKAAPLIFRPLPDSAVTYGRLTGCYWLRLVRRGNQFRALVSADGNSWTAAGSLSAPLGKCAGIGMAAASGKAGLTTQVNFDQVKFK